MHTIKRQLQQVLNKLQKWSNENGFKFSKSKIECMHYCQLRKHHLNQELTLDGTRIEVVSEFKFLGQKALNLLRVVSHMDWGADRKVLFKSI